MRQQMGQIYLSSRWCFQPGFPTNSIHQVKCILFFSIEKYRFLVCTLRIELAEADGAVCKQCFIRTFRNCKAVSGDLLHFICWWTLQSIQFNSFVSFNHVEWHKNARWSCKISAKDNQTKNPNNPFCPSFSFHIFFCCFFYSLSLPFNHKHLQRIKCWKLNVYSSWSVLARWIFKCWQWFNLKYRQMCWKKLALVYSCFIHASRFPMPIDDMPCTGAHLLRVPFGIDSEKYQTFSLNSCLELHCH